MRRMRQCGKDDLHEEPRASYEAFSFFMTALLRHPKVDLLLSDEHFSVDGTLTES